MTSYRDMFESRISAWTVSRLILQEISKTQKSTLGGVLCIFGSHTVCASKLVPIKLDFSPCKFTHGRYSRSYTLGILVIEISCPLRERLKKFALVMSLQFNSYTFSRNDCHVRQVRWLCNWARGQPPPMDGRSSSQRTKKNKWNFQEPRGTAGRHPRFMLCLYSDIWEPYPHLLGATLRKETHALQRTSGGLCNAIPADLLRAGSACGLGIDLFGICILSLAARFQNGSQHQNTPADFLATIRAAHEYDVTSFLAFLPNGMRSF